VNVSNRDNPLRLPPGFQRDERLDEWNDDGFDALADGIVVGPS
jgi:hypothetical protein